jgi:D-3-phosphoglycerate dehydrogenase
MKVLLLDENHEILQNLLVKNGFAVDQDYTSDKKSIENKIINYDGIVVRSRFPIDRTFLEKASSLKFIGRVGAGLENIDLDFTTENNIKVYNAPEGNRDAVGEHTLGMILLLLNRMKIADLEIRSGIWEREGNRGVALKGKTIGIIGYGNMGKAFAKRLQGFGVKTICYDISPNLGDENAVQVDLLRLYKETDILSLHTPLTTVTNKMVNENFINQFQKPFYLINTARGKSVVTKDLVVALKNGKILGACLDVLEYEKSSFENLFQKELPEDFKYLINSEKALLTPHIGGWTHESKEKLARVIAEKIISDFS